jgi:hypothetical protein
MDPDMLLAMEKAIASVTRTPRGIDLVHEYWRRQSNQGVVRATDFDPEDALGDPEKLGVTISLVDVEMENPWHFRFARFNGRYFAGLDGRCLSDFPLTPVINDCALEYFDCKAETKPSAHHIRHNLNGFSRNYLRLLLPLVGDDGSPTRIVTVGRHLGCP